MTTSSKFRFECKKCGLNGKLVCSGVAFQTIITLYPYTEGLLLKTQALISQNEDRIVSVEQLQKSLLNREQRPENLLLDIY